MELFLSGVCPDGEVIAAGKFDIQDMHSMVAQILQGCRQSAWKFRVSDPEHEVSRKLRKIHLTSISCIQAKIDSAQRYTKVHKRSLQSQNLRKMACNEFVMLASC